MEKQSVILKQTLKRKIEEIFQNEKTDRLLFIQKDLLQLLNFAYQFKISSLVPDSSFVHFQEDIEAVDNSKSSTLIFFLNPKTSVFITIQGIIARNEKRSIIKKYVIYLVPKIDHFCIDELKRLQIINKVELKSFSFGLVSITPGLISLQMSQYIQPLEIINLSVQALLKITKLSGIFNKIIGKGQKARMILQKYDAKLNQDLTEYKQAKNNILIVIDRRIDMFTPLQTGYSYEALLDHFYGINSNKINVPGNLMGKDSNKVQQYLLHNPKDPIYEQIAYLSIQQAKEQIKKRSKEKKSQIQQKRKENERSQNSKGINDGIDKLRAQYQQIQNHVCIILDIIEKMRGLEFLNLITLQNNILDQASLDFQQLHYLTIDSPPEVILRLICLYSQTYINPNFYTRFQKDILEVMVNNYHPKHIYSLYLLQKSGFLRNNKIKSKWQQLKTLYDLIPQTPHSYTDVHVRYSALSVRFIELLLKHKMTPEISAQLGRDNYMKEIIKQSITKEVYVFYIGGITYGQISCIRLLERQLNIKIHIVTTNVCSGSAMIRNLIQNSMDF